MDSIFYVRMLLRAYAIWRIYIHVNGWTSLMDGINGWHLNGCH